MMRAALEIADSRRWRLVVVGLYSIPSKSGRGGGFSFESLRFWRSFSIYSSKRLEGGVEDGEGIGLQETSEEDVLSAFGRAIVGIPRGLVLSRGLILIDPAGGGLSLIPLSLRDITRPRPDRGEPPVELGGVEGGDPLFTFISAASSCNSLGLGGSFSGESWVT